MRSLRIWSISLLLGLSCALGASEYASSLNPADTVSDVPQSWSTPPYWSAPSLQSSRKALAVTAPVPLPFVAIAPCRIVDTRGNGAPLTGGFLPAATVRNYTLSNICGIPANAQAISLNATVVNPTGQGFLVLWPQGGAFPPVSTLNFVANQTVANAAIVPLSASGAISVEFGVSGGDLILDTNGYYSPLGVVNSLNGQAGDLTLVAGNNVTLTPGTGTLSISAANGTGPQGPQGPQGAVGPQGPTGPQGATGATGSFDTTCAITSGDWTQFRDCLIAPTVVFNSIPFPTPPNVVSEGFECCQNAEFGDQITLAGTARKGVSATVLMSDWALHSQFPAMSTAGFTHPITLNIYSDPAHAAAHTPDIGTVTQSFLIPWRPEADATCPTPTAWRAGNGSCYNGFATPITFSLGGMVLPDTFIYGIAYNTRSLGYAAIGGASGPYDSLNVGLNSTPPIAVGTDVTTGTVWRADQAYGSAAGPFAPATGWSPYTPAVKFTTAN